MFKNQSKDEAAQDSLPRFQPQPGGFGRRTTPVGGASAPTPAVAKDAVAKDVIAKAPVAETPVPAEVANAGPLRPVDQTVSFGSGAQSGGTDIPSRIADWMLREMKDERGVHCETLLTAAGALAGFAAQQALWEGMIKPGKLAIGEAFRVIEAGSGETFFFGEATDDMLVSMDPKHQSLWRTISEPWLAQGGEQMPEISSLLRHCAASAGGTQFGIPRLPESHLPSMLPRMALERFWPGVRMLLSLAEPLTWGYLMTQATKRLLMAMQGSIAPDLALRVVMEAAIPMSRVDPTTVPN